jgi:hypothetical protein
MALYRVTLKNVDNGDQYELFPKSYSFVDELNKESTAKFTVGFEDVKKVADTYETDVMSMFTSTYREIWIERTDDAGVYQKIFYGIITAFGVAPDGQGARTINLEAVSWWGLFNRRICGIPLRTFTATDAGTIAWTLIDESQTSDNPYSSWGITQGVHPTTKNRDRTYRFDNVKDSIYKLSNNNLTDGFDFEIDVNKAFNIYYPTKGSDNFNIVFDERTMSNYSFRKPLILGLVNKIYVLGAGQNDDLIYVTRNASNAYKTDWKLQETIQRETDIIEVATLNDKGDKTLSDNQSPLPEFSAEHVDEIIRWDSYNLGDNIKVNLPEVGFSNETKRVIKKEFSMDSSKSIGLIKVGLK